MNNEFKFELLIGNIGISRDDFGNNLEDEIAFDLAFLMGTGCGTKEALLEAVYETAREVIAKARQELPE